MFKAFKFLNWIIDLYVCMYVCIQKGVFFIIVIKYILALVSIIYLIHETNLQYPIY